MESLVSKMVKDYEEGKISRRALIQSLAGLTLAAGTATAQSGRGFKTVSLDHISYQVSDYRRTRDFYADLMGMTVSEDNGTSQCLLGFGESLLIARNLREPSADGKPRVDHIAYKISDWNTDAVKAELERRGLTPRLDTGGNTPNYVSFHVPDPDGFDLQISGIAGPGDSQYGKP